MNVLIITVGSAGDVHPFIGLGRRLRQRGHRVVLATNAYFQEVIERAGLEFESTSTIDDFHRQTANPDLWHPTRAFKVLSREVPRNMGAQYDLVERHCRHENGGEWIVVGSSLAFGARVAQERLGITLATVHLSPAPMRSVIDPPILPGAPDMRKWPLFLRRWAADFADWAVIDRAMGVGVNEFRKSKGLGRAKGIMRTWWHSPQLVIGMWPAWFAAPPGDWPAKMRLTGFALYDQADQYVRNDELENFLSEGEAPIVFTPGSAMFHGRPFFEESLRACQILKCRALFVTPKRDQVPSSLPPTVRQVDYVPFSAVLPSAAAFVHHGGIGTVAQGLVAGIPQLVMPWAHDQLDNAQRLRRLGVAYRLRPSKYQAEQVAKSLQNVMNECASAAREIAGWFEGTDPLGRTCELLETLHRKK